MPKKTHWPKRHPDHCKTIEKLQHSSTNEKDITCFICRKLAGLS